VYIRSPRWCGDFQSSPCLSLIRDVGVIYVLIIFNVLRILSPAMKSSHFTDSEKGHSGKVTISRPSDDTISFSTLPSKLQEEVTKSATPARLPDATQGGASNISSLAKSLFRFPKRTKSTSSSTHMLMREPSTRSHSSTSSLDHSEFPPSTLPFDRPITPASNIGLPMPSEAVQKSTQPVPHLGIDLPSQQVVESTPLSPPPRDKRPQISRDPRPISGPPTLPEVPFLEVTLCSPTTSPAEGGVGSLINMYISRDASISGELPLFPDTPVHRDSSASLPQSTSSPSGWPRNRFPAPSDLPVDVPPEGIGSSLKAAVSVGAVGGRPTHPHLLPLAPHPNLLSARATSSAGATNGSQYSDSEGDAPPSSEASAARDTKASAQSGASREGQSSVQDNPARTLPLSRSLLSHDRDPRVELHKYPSSSSRYGYV
jgi:hypothetical protein